MFKNVKGKGKRVCFCLFYETLTHILYYTLFWLPLNFCCSMSKSKTTNLVSSVPFRLPTAQTNLVGEALIRHTTPPLPPLSKATKLRIKSPVFKSQSFTVPSSEEVMTNLLLNWRQVTALWCLWDPGEKIKLDGQNLIYNHTSFGSNTTDS